MIDNVGLPEVKPKIDCDIDRIFHLWQTITMVSNTSREKSWQSPRHVGIVRCENAIASLWYCHHVTFLLPSRRGYAEQQAEQQQVVSVRGFIG